MPYHIDSGRLKEAQWIASPNFDSRPPGLVIDLIVVHGISLPPCQFGTGDRAAFYKPT